MIIDLTFPGHMQFIEFTTRMDHATQVNELI